MRLKLTATTFILGLVLTAFGLLFLILTGCTHTKKTTSEKSSVTEKAGMTNIEYRTNTIYTDTGSITTYYRDSLIFSHDTVIQPIERIVNRWFKQEVKHDTFYIDRRFFVKEEAKEKIVIQEKIKLPWWFWLVVIGLPLLTAYVLIKGKR